MGFPRARFIAALAVAVCLGVPAQRAAALAGVPTAAEAGLLKQLGLVVN